ncbi:MAG: type III polyketide synthase [Bacteroidota bacterium]
MAFISAIGTAVPDHKTSQEDIYNFMQKAHGLEGDEARKLRVLYRATGIQTRHTVIEDYSQAEVRNFFPPTEDLEPFPSTAHRMKVYQEQAKSISLEAIRSAMSHLTSWKAEEITHLITVSCTGMYAPGLDIDLTNELGLNPQVQRTNVYFMGCQAAFNGLKVGNAICESDPNAKVLMVCVELCTLHFQKEVTEDSLLANSLFADGAAAVCISPKAEGPLSMSMEEFVCALHPEGKRDMAWKIGNFGFEMKLTSYVPDIIKGGIKQLTEKLFSSLKVSLKEVSHFAVHPGGKRILRFVEDELEIDREQNWPAHKVLKEYGNMSSPTILFVLKELWDNLKDKKESSYILNFAFGPGLTLESMLLKTYPGS